MIDKKNLTVQVPYDRFKTLNAIHEKMSQFDCEIFAEIVFILENGVHYTKLQNNVNITRISSDVFINKLLENITSKEITIPQISAKVEAMSKQLDSIYVDYKHKSNGMAEIDAQYTEFVTLPLTDYQLLIDTQAYHHKLQMRLVWLKSELVKLTTNNIGDPLNVPAFEHGATAQVCTYSISQICSMCQYIKDTLLKNKTITEFTNIKESTFNEIFGIDSQDEIKITINESRSYGSGYGWVH